MTVQALKVRRIAEPLYEDNLPDKLCITLDEVIGLIARHCVEIPEDEAKQIEEFIEKLLNHSAMSQFQRGLPPAAVMESLYRRWFAASHLHWELMEHANRSPVWRNWSGTGQPNRLDAEGRDRAMGMLARVISCNQDRFNDFLSGREQLTHWSTTADSAAFNAEERKWLNGLGFETKEVLDFLRAKEPLREGREGGLGLTSQISVASIPSGEIVVNVDAVVPNPVRQKQRRNELDDAIDKAIASVDSYRTPTVWQALRELALAGELPFTGGLDENGSLMYTKDQYSRDEKEPAVLTKKALGLRLIRRAGRA